MTTDVSSPKLHAAVAAAAMVQDGMVVGLGSGSTAALMVRRLGERVRDEGLKIVAVATSRKTADSAREWNIPLRELDDMAALDINLDGADEIDPRFQMIKGRGGALLREKIVVSAAKHRVTMITANKRVVHLGTTMPLPIEVSLFGVKHIERQLQGLGASTTLRLLDNGSPYSTDGGNAIIDCHFPPIEDPGSLDHRLQSMAGVLETGLFLDLCDTLIVGLDDGFERIDHQVSSH